VSAWYRKYEVQLRLGYYYLLSTALAAFSSILAYGLVQIGNDTNWKGWRWLFIIEGAATSLIGILSWFVLVDFPGSPKNKFLTPEEKEIVQARLAAERGANESHQVTLKSAYATICDWKVWACCYMYMTATMGAYAFGFFLPIILKRSMGYSQMMALLLNTPPQLFSVLTSLIVSKLSDKYKARGPFVAGLSAVSVVGLGMVGFLNDPKARYAQAP